MRVRTRLAAELTIAPEQTICYEITPSDPLPDLPLHASVAIHPIGADKVALLRQIWPLDIAEMQGRLQRGDLCYLGQYGGAPVHYSWVQRSGVHRLLEAAQKTIVAQGEFWIYHCRTAEAAKGLGIYPCTLARIVRDHFAAGFTRGRIYTTGNNSASQRGIVKAGFRLHATLRSVRLGRFFLAGEENVPFLTSPEQNAAAIQR